MNKVTANVAGPVRRETLQGRSYLVAPVTLIVPGVMDGSDGPIYYPAEEVALSPESWNGMPLVGYHAFKDGVAVSARRPDVLDRQGLGVVLNTHFDGKLKGEAWFDEALTEKFDQSVPPAVKIIPRLRAGTSIEVSTGLFSKKEPAPTGATFNGKAYHTTARSYRPDHLAVLPDQVGACQIKDGCGILINHHQRGDCPVALTPEQKQAHVTYLITNCAWWKKPGDAVILNNLPDDKLQELREGAEKGAAPPVPTPPQPVAPAVAPTLTLSPQQMIELAELLKQKFAPAPGTPAVPPVTPPVQGPPPVTPPAVPSPATIPVATPVTANQWLETAPPEIRSVFQNALAVEKAEKDSLVQRLTANVADPAAKQAAGQMLMPKSLEELRALVKLMGMQPTNNQGHQQVTPAGLFLGMAAPGPSHVQGYDPVNGSDEDLLTTPTINWGKPKAAATQPNGQPVKA